MLFKFFIRFAALFYAMSLPKHPPLEASLYVLALWLSKVKGGFGSLRPPEDRHRRDDVCRYHDSSGAKRFMAA